MNRIDEAFTALQKENKKALITFVTAGDPDYKTTEALVQEMIAAGADIIELGVPFSDPVAEGPVIQHASARSLRAGTSLQGIFELVSRLRETATIPLLLMMYCNSIYRFGKNAFFAECAWRGIDGVIVPDMPYEERGELQEYADRYGVYSIRLVAPTSRERIKEIGRDCDGFLYCVSSTGVTGMRSSFQTDFDAFFGTIKKYVNIPCAVGFGISTPEQVRKMKQYCEGVIVGSAIVRIVAEYGKASPPYVAEFTRSLRAALDEP